MALLIAAAGLAMLEPAFAKKAPAVGIFYRSNDDRCVETASRSALEIPLKNAAGQFGPHHAVGEERRASERFENFHPSSFLLLMRSFNSTNRFRFNAFAKASGSPIGAPPKESSLQAVRPRAALGADADVRLGSRADPHTVIGHVRFSAGTRPRDAVG
jgi:hypothetical protein